VNDHARSDAPNPEEHQILTDDTEVRIFMKVDYHLAREEDLEPAHEALVESLNQFAMQRALPLVDLDFEENLPLWRHFLGTSGEGFLVAEVKKRLAGFCCNILRDKLWYLSYFVVVPEFQGTGLGRDLFAKALTEVQENKEIEVIAAYTNASNWPSISLYTRNGMFPRMPVLKLEGDISGICEATREVQPLEGIVAGLAEDTITAIDDIDLKLRGINRDVDHRFWLGAAGMRCYLFKKRGKVTGYAYISDDGTIGPLATLNAEDDVERMLCFCLDRLSSQGVDSFTVHVPGANTAALTLLYDRGFKIQELGLIMSSLPFGKWENYIISRPSLL
jgi:ribosomal protein S18 acetylase RimI-like enzyme